MKKRTDMGYSMTRKQRKNRAESSVDDKKTNEPELSEEEKAAAEELQAQKKSKRKKIFSIMTITVSIILSVALIVCAVVIPRVISYNTPPEGNPIAKIYLKGLKDEEVVLEFELFADTAPIATSNFIFLARSGFFDNTVINDIQGRWARFSGYEGLSAEDKSNPNSYYKRANHRANNPEFAKSVDKYFKKYNINYFTDVNSSGYKSSYNETQIFNYRLRSEKSASSLTDLKLGDLVFYYGSSSTTMMMVTGNNPQMSAQKPNQSATFSSSTKFGKFNNSETKQLLESLYAIEESGRTKDISDTIWKNPIDEIFITKIEIVNLFEKQWKEILNNTGIDVYLESVIDPERDSYTASGHTYSNYATYY